MALICVNNDTTVTLLLSQYVTEIGAKAFLDTKKLLSNKKEGATNWESIQRSYTKEELDNNKGKYPNGSILIKAGTQLELRPSYIKRDLSYQVPTDVSQLTDYKPFIASQLSKLLKDPQYVRQINAFSGEKLATVDINDITVYIWCRALTGPCDNSQSGTWFNVSNFISSLQTQVSENSGQFNFSIAPVVCEWKDGATDGFSVNEGGYFTQSGWQLSSDTKGYDTGDIKDNILSQTSVLQYNPKQDGEFYRNKFLFNTILQENDLVYIKFEKLSLESEEAINNFTVNGRINPQSVTNQIWDMIGLIDGVSSNTTANSVNINVYGRDCMKLLIEDGSYFFPEQIAQQIFTNEDSILTKRNLIEFEAQSLLGAGSTFKTVDTILKYIFNKFSNIGIVSNEAFIGYGQNALLDKYQLKSSKLTSVSGQVIDELNEKFLQEKRQGLWRIIDFVFDAQASQRVLADNSISTDNGSIINSIRKVTQQPFIEFCGDTYGDRYNFFVRKPPFDEKGYKGMVYDNFVTESGTSVNTTGKIGGDDFLANSIRKQQEENKNSNLGRESSLSDLVIDIDDVDVLGEPQLSYHNEAYSWYQVTPRGVGLTDENAKFLLAPVVPFDEYAKVWGNKSYNIEYNYVPAEYTEDSQTKSLNKYLESQTFYDLQYVIQSNMYLPFTRRGTIILTGNRTIKRGLFIYYKPTKEVFYVDTVSHSRSIERNGINRTTILQVSRGMREPYIKGKLMKFASGDKLTGYFGLINTRVANGASINNKEFLKNWKVDADIFNFFLQRRQWVD